MSVLIKPIVTEKLTTLSDARNQYGFEVAKDANKIQIKKAVEEMYNVTVVSVNTMNNQGKLKSRFTKAGIIEGRTKSMKKAIVTLADGDNIDFYSNI